ncbi:tryptophanyl-tRNA synthetase [candidate division MSBL1 archaeon SCGC-AAA382F02]|uniref:Tryptophan--tRNA ligase n=1 Tax=candidate division MSBL1 archaeon SCGC-AAA382F02 TaxID=1698282 RepID=A0A133VHR1_9EURY|nr:tryptophanyl-tRNA synthetase [candidate division MSBL1 archaeon SCGC-AAA382F02]
MTQQISPWNEAVPQDYAELMEKFGIEPFDKLIDEIPDPSPLMRRKIIFGHRDFKRILKAINKGKDYVVMTGLMPSGKMHLGHKLVVDQLIWYLEHNAEIYLCVADLESHIARDLSLEEAREMAIEEYLTNYQALGLDLEKCHVYFQSESDAVQKLAYELGKKVNFSELKAIYGFGSSTDASHIFYPMIDAADILRPQLEEHEGPITSVVPVGIDQDPHLRLARDIADRLESEYGFIPPSSTYNRLIPGLTGKKMSSSEPKSAIFLTDSEEEMEEKISNAVTGGRHTVSEQREKGGKPDECMIYSLYVYHLLPDDEELLELRKACESGEIVCGECKEKAKQLLKDFLSEHNEKRKDVEKIVEKISEK